MIVRCDFCDKEFTKTPSKIRNTNFCCRKCQNTYQARKNASKVNQPNIACDNCGVKFHKKPSNKSKLNFCNLKCKQEHFKNNHRILKICEGCNNEYSVIKTHAENYNSRFCSKECYDKWQRRSFLYTKCYTCGKDISIRKSRQDYNITGMYFCSNKCANETLLSKEFNPNYKGTSDIMSTLRHYYAVNQRGLIFKKYNKKCSCCGENAEEVHHLYPLYKIIEDYIITHIEYNIEIEEDRLTIINNIIDDKDNKFNDLDNLIAVCKNCHDSIYHNSGWKQEFD